MNTRRPVKRRGFTLIELLIVIVVIGVLATIAIRVFWSAKDRGIEATMKSDLRTISAHQENYFERHYVYAGDPSDLPDFGASPGVDIVIGYSGSDGWAATATSPSLVNRTCGMLFGAAPDGTAGPILVRNRIECADDP